MAAGAGRRFGGLKQHAELAGKPLWQWAQRALLEGGVGQVVLVGPVPDGVPGGPRRRDSVAAGLAEVPDEAEFVLVHDAARPLASSQLVAAVIERMKAGEAAAVVPAVPIDDALKKVEADTVTEALERHGVVAAQTPQGFIASVLRGSHAAIDDDSPDDAALVERAGHKVAVIPGEPTNLKVTRPHDLSLAEALLTAGEPATARVGWGYDAHRFGGPGPLLLAGVLVDPDRGLEATSDGDVAAHAVADAILGGGALGDLGTHFPSDDPRWRGADSMKLLARVAAMMRDAGWTLRSVDLTVLAEEVRVSPHREEMREGLASILAVDVGDVSVKATSTDRMGPLGAGEGLAAVAVVVLGPVRSTGPLG